MAGVAIVLAENACDGGGDRRFDFIETSEGLLVAAALRYEEFHPAQKEAHVTTEKPEELLGTIEHFKTQQNGLMTTMERNSRMMKGHSEEIPNKFLQEVLVSKDEFTDVESELVEADAEPEDRSLSDAETTGRFPRDFGVGFTRELLKGDVEKKKGSGAGSVSYAGLRLMPSERHGRGHG